MNKNVDVVVVGAGVVGLTAAYELGRGGASVVVLDAAPGIGGGCSYANAGIIAPLHVGPLATRALVVEGVRQMFAAPAAVRVRPRASLAPWLARLIGSARASRARPAAAVLARMATRSADRHRVYFESGTNPSYRRTGALDVHLRRAASCELTPEQARALVPALGRFAAASHDPDEAVVESRAYMAAMAGAAEQTGAVDIRFGARAQELVVDGARVQGVRLTRGMLRARHVVLAAGLSSASLARPAGLRLPLRGGRGYVVDLQVSGDVPGMAVRLKERRIVITPFPDRLRVCGMIEFGAEGRRVDQSRAAAMVAAATAALPGIRVESVLDTWCGERPCSADGVPLIGPSRTVPGLWVAAGHGMWGLVLAPVTAEMAAADILRAPGPEPEPLLSPDRFSRPRAARSKGLPTRAR